MLVTMVALLLAAPEPSERQARSLLTAARDACGGDAWDRVRGWRETGTVELPGGMVATHEAWSDMAALKSASRATLAGRVIRRAGYDGTTAWRAGPDGKASVTTDAATLRRQRRDSYLSSFGYFLPARFPAAVAALGERHVAGRTLDGVRVTPEGADSADLWIDRATRHVARFEADGEFAELSNYRTFDGVCTATTGRQGDGDPARAIVLRIEAVVTAPIDAAVFAPPR